MKVVGKRSSRRRDKSSGSKGKSVCTNSIFRRPIARMRNFGRLNNNYSADINSCRRLLPIKEKPSKRPKLPSLLEPPKIKNSILSSVCAPPERKWTTSTPSSASEKHPNPTLPSSGPSQKHRPNSSWTNHPFKKAKRTANAHQIQTKIQAKTVNLHSRVDHPKKVRRNRCYWR